MKRHNAVDWEAVQKNVGRYTGQWTDPALHGQESNRLPDTALMGNGDIGVSSGGNANEKTFYIGKGNFWTVTGQDGNTVTGSVRTVGGITLKAAGKLRNRTHGGFSETQDILRAEVRTVQTIADAELHIKTWTSATENIIVMEITNNGAVQVELSVVPFVRKGLPVSAAVYGDIALVTRDTADPMGINAVFFASEEVRVKAWRSRAAIAAKVIGARVTEARSGGEDNGLLFNWSVTKGGDAGRHVAAISFAVLAGQTVYVVTAVTGGGKTYDFYGKLNPGQRDPVGDARDILSGFSSERDIRRLREAHDAWWNEYWRASYVDIISGNGGDTDLETVQRYYYGAQYMLACTAREGKVAPGLYGVWVTGDNPAWNGDYTLNYNFIATWYGAGSSNRASFIRPAADAMADFMQEGY
ncbi:MAG: hypothetical protein LBQ48_00945 [Oscillospiraceae bacterium]|nr:hypothetical protein [Oscillospiraceae bacterium]